MRSSLRILVLSLFFVLFSLGAMLFIVLKKMDWHRIIDLFQKNEITQIGYYRVTHVYDGDTIAVDMLGNTEKVRLIGVDTPETHDPDSNIQCFGPESSNFTKTNLLNKKVKLESDPTNQNRDRYDRLLRYVYLEDGRLWNQTLIEYGYGFAYLRYPFTKLDNFRLLENKSREKKLGLWSNCKPRIVNGLYRSNDF